VNCALAAAAAACLLKAHIYVSDRSVFPPIEQQLSEFFSPLSTTTKT